MRQTRKLQFLFLFISIVAVIKTDSLIIAQKAGSAESAETIDVAGLKDRVLVRRDQRGIPYIEALNEADLYFAQGYVMASDRLWQMDVLRRTVRGELSEIFGRPTAAEDKRRRVYGFAQLADPMLENTSPKARAALEAFARGVNAYIESKELRQLPPEFQILQYKPRTWTPGDSLLIGKIFSEALSTTWQSDLLRLALSDLPKEKREMLLVETSPLDVLVVGNDNSKGKGSTDSGKPESPKSINSNTALMRSLSSILEIQAQSLERVGLYMEDRAASNNWVVSGSRSSTGKPILANDPHLPSIVPSIWYMVHLSLPDLRLAGVTAPGAPGVIIGHNDQIAWGVTNLGPDVQDLYLEKFDKDSPGKYMTPTGLRVAVVRKEEVKIRKGFADASTDSEFVDITVTRHGPIIFEKDGARYALRWTALDPKSVEFDAFYDINRARNWKEFQTALSRYGGPTQNFVYADKDGHIGYYGAGRIPVRKTGDGSTPYDGSTDEGEWTSFIPFQQLPHISDPPSGFIVTANQRVAGRSYSPHLTHEWPTPYRARRIYEMLQARSKSTPEDMRNIQADTLHIGLSTFARETVKLGKSANAAIARNHSDASWSATFTLLANWDGRMNLDSAVAPLAIEMRLAFRRRILEAALGAERAKSFSWSNEGTFLDRLITERPQQWLPSEFKSYEELLRACANDAREALTKALGTDEAKWTWGIYRPMRLRHPLAGVPLIGDQFAIAPFPLNGSGGAVNVGPYVSMRFIATLDNWDTSRQGIALGESGEPSNAHFKDQLEDWRNVTPRVFPFTVDAVTKSAPIAMTLMPKK